MLVGGLQLPVVLLMDKTLGGSTSVSVMVGQLFAGPLEKLSPYAAKCRRWKFENFWQVLITDISSAILPHSIVESNICCVVGLFVMLRS